jgi:hypothetical protein
VFAAGAKIGAIFEWQSTFPQPPAQIPSKAMSAAATLARPLCDRIFEALTSNPHVPNHTVRFEAADGRVVLKGSVTTFFQKQMAQEAVRRIDGVEQIENLLQVNWA